MSEASVPRPALASRVGALSTRALDRAGFGLEAAARSALGPLLLGLRWTRVGAPAEAPPASLDAAARTPARTLGLAGKMLADELFYASEVLTSALPRTLPSLRERGRLRAELEEALALASATGWSEAPERYHRTPPPLERVAHARMQQGDLAFEEIRFESGYAPHDGEPGRARWLGYARNRTAHAWLLRHRGPPRPWVLCVPGYRMGSPRVDFVGFRARWMHRALGLNVAIPVLPLHGPRAVGARSGDGFFAGELLDTVHGVAQGVWDVRRVADWLRREPGAPAIALHGLSLGAGTAALVAGLEDDLACVIAGIPASDFARLTRESVPPLLQRLSDRAKFPWADVEKLMRVVSPLALAPRVPHSRRYVFAGLVDRLASPEHARRLWEHWERPRIAWYAGGHVSFCFEREVETFVHEALVESGVAQAPVSRR